MKNENCELYLFYSHSWHRDRTDYGTLMAHYEVWHSGKEQRFLKQPTSKQTFPFHYYPDLNEARKHFPIYHEKQIVNQVIIMRTILLRDCSSSDSSFDTPIPCSVEKVIVDTPLKKDDVNLLVRLDGNEAQFEIEPITPCSLDFNSESQADVEDRDDNQNHIFTYPSGRLPLVPIDNRASSKSRPDVDKEAIEKKHKKCAKKEKESMSWISKTFCGLPSNSTLDNLGDITNDEIAMNCPFDDNVRFISDEGSVILVDDLDEGNANFYPYEDYAHTPQMKVGREKSIFRERTPQTPSNDTFDNLFQHALSCNTWQNWYDDEVCYKSKTQLLSTRCISKHPYNSSIDPKAKKKKMHHLRLNISPFGMAAFEETNQSPSKKYKPIKMRKKTISFPGKSHSQKKASANSKWTKNKSKKDYEWSSSIIATCGNFSHTQDIEIVPKFNCYDDESDGALCYDSDPGDQSFTSGPPMTRSLPIEHCRMNESQLEFDEDDLINEDICEDMVSTVILCNDKGHTS